MHATVLLAKELLTDPIVNGVVLGVAQDGQKGWVGPITQEVKTGYPSSS